MASPTAEVLVFPDPAALAEAAAGDVAATLTAAVAAHGTASLVLAGGSTPRALYEKLASPEWRDRVPWAKVALFWGDERCVPPDDPASNYRMVLESLAPGLAGGVAVPAAAIHRMEGELCSGGASAVYDRRLHHLAGDPPRFDLALLGLGADGHTASLFPATPDPEGAGHWAIATEAPDEPRRRVSLTLAALAGAATILFLVAGADKAPAVARTLARTPPLTPAARVRPAPGGRLAWLLDRAAASTFPQPLSAYPASGLHLASPTGAVRS